MPFVLSDWGGHAFESLSVLVPSQELPVFRDLHTGVEVLGLQYKYVQGAVDQNVIDLGNAAIHLETNVMYYGHARRLSIMEINQVGRVPFPIDSCLERSGLLLNPVFNIPRSHPT